MHASVDGAFDDLIESTGTGRQQGRPECRLEHAAKAKLRAASEVAADSRGQKNELGLFLFEEGIRLPRVREIKVRHIAADQIIVFLFQPPLDGRAH